jgi:hypothetical protein
VSRFVSWTCSRLDKSCRCMFLLFFSSYSSSVLLSGFVNSAGCGSFLHRCFRCWLRALLFLLLRFSLLTFVWLVLVLRLLRILSTLRCYSQSVSPSLFFNKLPSLFVFVPPVASFRAKGHVFQNLVLCILLLSSINRLLLLSCR